MNGSEMELSLNSQSSSSSRSSTPKSEMPLTDCERRRNAVEILKKQQIIIDGYQKYMDSTRNQRDDTGVRRDFLKTGLSFKFLWV
ncbi:hypothetical protein TNCV_850301 [Trichonephila clavipes]|uniref:Uncharacterized protein n=1 Tax=Trichonephila clavipes TaxID=2585209 RepID=A0A8X6S1X5_TRICX|nr:hypothetical protein TNCV_850301 [Trichonephila clavipes]